VFCALAMQFVRRSFGTAEASERADQEAAGAGEGGKREKGETREAVNGVAALRSPTGLPQSQYATLAHPSPVPLLCFVCLFSVPNSPPPRRPHLLQPRRMTPPQVLMLIRTTIRSWIGEARAGECNEIGACIVCHSSLISPQSHRIAKVFNSPSSEPSFVVTLSWARASA